MQTTAILGWGSLIWNPKNLDYVKEVGWLEDGPVLPIEFARISKDGRLTLVITENGTEVKTLYAISKYKTLDEAILNLAVREGSGRKSIGSYNKKTNQFSSNNSKLKEKISDWIKDKEDIDAVIWTDLPENWEIKNEKKEVIKTINPDDRIDYLEKLKGSTSVLAEEYIRKAPAQIRTKYRKLIEEQFNWMPIV